MEDREHILMEDREHILMEDREHSSLLPKRLYIDIK